MASVGIICFRYVGKPMINYQLENKTALVTGGASGIGLATAELLAKSSAFVAVNDLENNPELAGQIDRLTDLGYKVIAAPGDTGRAGAAQQMVQQAIADLGGSLDFLVNNAGTPGTRSVVQPDDFETQNEAFWDRLVNVNLKGPQRCIEAAVDALRKNRGAIVNTASVSGLRGNGSSSVYSATKAGLITLTQEHARVLGPAVRVNAIAPGLVESNWECRFDVDDNTIQSIPLQRIGQPADYADVIVYLLAGATYITGETVVVDGGLLTGRR